MKKRAKKRRCCSPSPSCSKQRREKKGRLLLTLSLLLETKKRKKNTGVSSSPIPSSLPAVHRLLLHHLLSAPHPDLKSGAQSGHLLTPIWCFTVLKRADLVVAAAATPPLPWSRQQQRPTPVDPYLCFLVLDFVLLIGEIGNAWFLELIWRIAFAHGCKEAHGFGCLLFSCSDSSSDPSMPAPAMLIRPTASCFFH